MQSSSPFCHLPLLISSSCHLCLTKITLVASLKVTLCLCLSSLLSSLKNVSRWALSKALNWAPSLHRNLQWLHLTQDKSQSQHPCNGLPGPWWPGPSGTFCEEANAGTFETSRVSPHILSGPALQLLSDLEVLLFNLQLVGFIFTCGFFFSFLLWGLHYQVWRLRLLLCPPALWKAPRISAGICHGLNVSCMSLLFSLSVLETIGLIQIHPKDMTLYNITFSL